MRWHQMIMAAGLICISLLVASPTHGSAGGSQPLDEVFAPFAQLLEHHLIEKKLESGGLVSAFDYTAALQDPRTRGLIDEQNRILAEFDRDSLNTRERAISFWLNAYNYFMAAHILENPLNGNLVSSVRDYGSIFRPYRVFSQELFDVGGRKFSLDEMEKDILLGDEFRSKGWKEARVHFAVNCASVGCPPLRKQAYLPDNVDRLMTENTQYALKTERHFHRDGDTLYITRLFDWYKDDYIEESGSVAAFLKRYGNFEVKEAVNHTRSTRFIDYDWDLNRPENFPEFSN